MTDETRVPALPWPLCRFMQPPGAAKAAAAAAGGSGAGAPRGARGGGPAPQVEVVEDRLVVTGAPLDSVLAVVESHLGVEVELVRCERTITGGLGGFFGREQFVVEARPLGSDNSPASVSTAAVSPSAVAPAPVDGHTFADALAAALADLDAAAVEEPAVELPDPAATASDVAVPAAAVVDATVPDAADLLLALLAERADVLDLSQVDHASLDRIVDLIAPDTADTVPTPIPADPERSDVSDPAEVSDLVPSSELRSGSALLAMSAPHMSFDQVLTAVRELTGAAPPLPSSGIVAVVGDAGDALRTAEALAVSVGADPGDVLVMSPTPTEGRPSWMCVATAEDAIRRRDRWMQNDRVTFVAVVLTPGADGMNWGCVSLDALSPTQTRLAVPGWRHAEDVEHRLRCLAPVDAIDLVDPTDVAACAGFMDLDVPVGSIGGAPATPEVWAEWLRSAAPTTSPATIADAVLSRTDHGPTDTGVLRRAVDALDPSGASRTISAPSFPVVAPTTRTGSTGSPWRAER